MDLQGKNAIITGSARGMGAATVRAFMAAGANVVAMDLNDEGGQEVVQQAKELGPGDAHYQHVDVSNKDSVDAAFDKAVAQLGDLHILAHPAAIQAPSQATTVSVEEWDTMFAVNVRGTMLTNQAAYPHLKKAGGGSIINFGSISGQRPEPGSVAYSASKGAVHSWTRSAAANWGPDKVRVNAILPAIATPMFENAISGMSEEQMNAMYWINLHTIVLGNEYGDADRDLGPVMVFLASDASRFITGQMIPVDGGQTNVR